MLHLLKVKPVIYYELKNRKTVFRSRINYETHFFFSFFFFLNFVLFGILANVTKRLPIKHTLLIPSRIASTIVWTYPPAMHRNKNGPSASELEVAIKGFIPAPRSQESFPINFRERKVQLMLITVLVPCFTAETCTFLTANIYSC